MLRDITLGQYYQTESVIHRLDPRVKLAGTVIFIISLFCFHNIWGYLCAALFLFAVVKLSKVPFKFMVKGMRSILFLLLITVVFNLFLTPGETVLTIWKLHITKEGIRIAVFMVIRLTMLIIGSSLMTLTTTPNNLTDGMEKAMRPLKIFRLPVHEIAMIMSIALRFIPILMEETDKIMKAQIARGADFESGNIFKKAKAMVPLLVPLFISAFRRANDLAMAMEARCYRGGEGRTKMKPLIYKKRDAAAYLLLFVYLAGSIVVDRVPNMIAKAPAEEQAIVTEGTLAETDAENPVYMDTPVVMTQTAGSTGEQRGQDITAAAFGALEKYCQSAVKKPAGIKGKQRQYDSWQEAYSAIIGDWTLIENYDDFSYLSYYFGEDYGFDSYWLCDVDGNGTPELFLYSESMCGMTAVFTYEGYPVSLSYDRYHGINRDTGELIVHGHWHGAGGTGENEYAAWKVIGTECVYSMCIDFYDFTNDRYYEAEESHYYVYDTLTQDAENDYTIRGYIADSACVEAYEESCALHVEPCTTIDEYEKYNLSDFSGLDNIQDEIIREKKN